MSAPQCCGQTAEFIVNGNSDSLQYYYCRACKTEPRPKDPEPAISNVSNSRRSQVCLSISMTFGHDFTHSKSKCTHCGESDTAVWDGKHHSWVGDGSNTGTFCMLCSVIYDKHMPLPMQCYGAAPRFSWAAPNQVTTPAPSQPTSPPPSHQLSQALALSAHSHYWGANSGLNCSRCGIAAADFNNYGTPCNSKIGTTKP